MKHIVHTLSLCLLTLVAKSVGGQTTLPYSYGIDHRRDSLQFELYQKYMDSIRTERPTVALVLRAAAVPKVPHT